MHGSSIVMPVRAYLLNRSQTRVCRTAVRHTACTAYMVIAFGVLWLAGDESAVAVPQGPATALIPMSGAAAIGPTSTHRCSVGYSCC